MIETVEKRPYPPFDRLRASGVVDPAPLMVSLSNHGRSLYDGLTASDLDHLCMSVRGELVEPGTAHQSVSTGMIAALVPVKALPRSKSRLRPVLSDDQRQALVVAMLEDVLRLLAGVPAIATTAVVSPDADLLALARQLGAQAIREPPQPGGLNAALTFASRMLCDQGARTLLVLPIDVPLATADDIEAILDRVRGNPSIVLCPSRSGGTNALALRPPGIIPFRFGRHSSAAHQREARARGLPLTVLSLPSLALDIDRPKDLAAVLAQPNGSRSRELLASLPLDLTSLWQTAADPTPSPHPLVLRRHALILSPSKDERTRAHGSTGSP